MDRWALLKARIKTGKSNSASINSFDGLSLIKPRKIAWVWSTTVQDFGRSSGPYSHRIDAEISDEKFFNCMEEQLRARDCAEIRVNLKVPKAISEEVSALLTKHDFDTDAKGRVRILSGSNKDDHQMSSCTDIKYDVYEFFVKDRGDVQLEMPVCQYLAYPLVRGETTLNVYTREHVRDRKITAADLQSHLHHGVDNTGNTRVWDAESVLLHTLLHGTRDWEAFFSGKRVLELGGGMTALCGLGLMALGWPSSIVLTDGHPACARNIDVCIHMHAQKYPGGTCHARAAHCKWDRHSDSSLAHVLEDVNTAEYDVAIVCDCLFFTDFHRDLLFVLSRTVKKGGHLLLMQPPRAGSMQRFFNCVRESGLFSEPEVTDTYNDEVTRRLTLLRTSESAASFKEDIHMPLLVTLTVL